MRTLLVWIAFALLSHTSQAQWEPEPTYDDVVAISQKDVTQDGRDFLIDIAIRPTEKLLVLFNDDARIASKLFFDRRSFLPEQRQLLLVTRDWEYYRHLRDSEKSTGYHIKPVAQFKYYRIRRNAAGYQVDSLTRRAEEPGKAVKLNFALPQLAKDEGKYYIEDCYGSKCCPRDPKRDTLGALQDEVAAFEQQHKVKVNEGVVLRYLGKEGEHCAYFPLSGLTNKQRMQAVHIFYRFEKPHAKLFLPTILKVR